MLGPFQAGIGRFVAGTQIPVVPCYLSGGVAAWPSTRRFPGPGRLTVNIGQPVVFPGVPDDREGWSEVADALRAAVMALGASPGTPG